MNGLCGRVQTRGTGRHIVIYFKLLIRGFIAACYKGSKVMQCLQFYIQRGIFYNLIIFETIVI